MRKACLFVLLGCWAFTCLSVVNAQRSPRRIGVTARSKARKTKPSKTFYCQLPYSVNALTLDRQELDACNTSDGAKIDVATAAVVGEDSRYAYAVSAGKVVGGGANVVWDLY